MYAGTHTQSAEKKLINGPKGTLSKEKVMEEESECRGLSVKY